MANSKISALTSATTPLAGTETLPIVQSSTTKQVSVANLTAGRAVAMGGGSFTDSITQSTAAKGIDFSANTAAAGKTSTLLNWYEEGTWTPVLTFSIPGDLAVTYSVQVGRYTRIGRQVTVIGAIETSAFTHSTAAGALRVSGLPFTSANVTGLPANGTCSAAGWTRAGNWFVPQIAPNATNMLFQTSTSGAAIANVSTADVPSGTQQILRVSVTYFV